MQALFPRTPESPQRIVVIGDAMLDSYLRGTATRLCREAPVPIVEVEAHEEAAGGAANTALNVAALGGQVAFVSTVGDDVEADALIRLLTAQGVDCSAVLRSAERTTLAKRRMVANDQLLLRVDQGSVDPLDPADEAQMTARLREGLRDADALIISDYGYGMLTPEVLSTIEELRPRVLVVDARDLTRYRGLAPSAVKPNYEEAIRLLQIPEARGTQSRAVQLAEQRDRLHALTGAEIVAATLDVDGALVFAGDSPPYRTYTQPAPTSATAGAGDSFVAALTLALSAGVTPLDAAEVATAAASVVVRKPGTSVCSAAELHAQLLGEGKVLPDAHALALKIGGARALGGRVVFTNGCFDILHRGHVTYLSRAKALGDILIVGINADDSVRRLKGSDRPINQLEDRMQVLSALSCVDYVVPFEEDTPVRLLEAVRPDVFVKGGDYSLDTLPEAGLVESLGGTVRILPYVEDQSTTGIINRISAGHRVSPRRHRRE